MTILMPYSRRIFGCSLLILLHILFTAGFPFMLVASGFSFLFAAIGKSKAGNKKGSSKQ